MAACWPEHKKVQFFAFAFFKLVKTKSQMFETTIRFACGLKMDMWLYHLRGVEWDALQTGMFLLMFFRDVNISVKSVLLSFYRVRKFVKTTLLQEL